MKIVVMGGTGLIGRGVVSALQKLGHEAVPASPSLDVNSVTGEGLAEALQGATVVVDVTNSPSFDPAVVLSFFTASTTNLLAEAAAAGVQHFVALSVVGADWMPGSGYMQGKVVQERMIAAGPVPYTIVRATQFFEFLGAIADGSTVENVIRVAAAPMQPIAAADVSTALASVATSAPANGIIDIAGPEKRPMADFLREYLAAHEDPREVHAAQEITYFGAVMDARGLAPAGSARLAGTSLQQWLAQQPALASR